MRTLKARALRHVALLAAFVAAAGAVAPSGTLGLHYAEHFQGEVLVQLKPGASRDDIEATIIDSLSTHSGRMLLKVGVADGESLPQALARLIASEFVDRAEPNYVWRACTLPVHPLSRPSIHLTGQPPSYHEGLSANTSQSSTPPSGDPDFWPQWNLHNVGQDFYPGILWEKGIPGADVDAASAWAARTDASEVLVALLDTGVSVNHPDLAQNIWRNQGEIPDDGIDNDGNGYIDDVHGWDFLHDDGSVFDGAFPDMHGTHIAGIIAADGGNGIAVAGVAWKAPLLPLKVLGPDGVCSTWALLEAIDYAVRMGASIACCTWSAAGYSSLLETAIADSGMLFIVAAGNTGADNDLDPRYPACYDLPNIISVAASDWNDNLANFSSYGRESVHIAAPGHWIISTYGPVGSANTAWMGGTSQAAAHVAGAAALVAAAHPDIPLFEGAGAPGPGQGARSQLTVRKVILESADQHPSLAGKVSTGARLNVANAVSLRFPLRAEVSADIAFGQAPLGVRFTATVDRPADVAAVYWHFDDLASTLASAPTSRSAAASRQEGFTAYRVFEEEGSYLVRFTAVAADGSVTEWPIQVVVANPGTAIYVDDDGGHDWSDSFLADAAAAGIDCVSIDARLPFSLPANLGPRMLIWDTGLSWNDTLLPDQEDYLAACLDSGGRLLLLSADYFTDRAQVTPFARDYLHVADAEVDVSGWPPLRRWEGVSGDPITDGMSFEVIVGRGLEDALVPASGAQPILVNRDGSEPVYPAIRYADDTYRVVFSTMPWSELPMEGDDPNNSVYLLKKIYDYLTEGIGTPPPPPPPELLAQASKRFVPVGEEVTFKAAAEAATFVWSFSDGADDMEGPVVAKAFTEQGLHVAALTATWDDGRTSQASIEVAALEPDDVVYVFDEAPGGAAGEQLDDALRAIGQGFVQVEPAMMLDQAASREGLERFRVLWNCGELGTVDAAELDAIADYLVRGGGLFLIGQDALQGDPACAEMMRVAFVHRDVGCAQVFGVEDSIISGAGHMDLVFPVEFEDRTDVLAIAAQADPVLFTEDGSVCALSYSGQGHRLVFMSLAFEALSLQSPMSPLKLLANVLAWLNRPLVTVLSPVGGEVYVGAVPVRWSADDRLGEELAIGLAYLADGGESWTQLASGESDDGEYTWSVPRTAPGGRYVVRVTASKAGGYSGHGDSGEFVVAAAGVSEFAFGPNPASDFVNFYVNAEGGAALYVHDIAGRLVTSTGSRQVRCTMCGRWWAPTGRPLPNGLYMCYLVGEDGARSEVRRLVISR